MKGGPSDQKEFGQYICERDNNTCQRCGVEEPDNGLAIARLEPLEAESDQENQTGERDPENHLTLCRPCLAVTRPNDEELDEYRLEASLYPVDDADPRIAYVNSRNPYETESAFADRILQGGWLSSLFGKECARCKDEFDVDELVVFPAYSSVGTNPPGERCEAVCRPCAGVIVSGRNNPLPAPILDHEGAVCDTDHLRDMADCGKMTGPDGPLGEERDPVNRKERLMSNPIVSRLRLIWGIGVTLGLIIALPEVPLNQSDVGLELLWALFSGLRTLPVLAENRMYALYFSLVGTFFSLAVAASTIRWGSTWLFGVLWRLDPSVSAQHYRRQVFWRWRDIVTVWVGVFAVLAALPVLIPLFMLYAFFTTDSNEPSRQPQTYGYSHNWSRTTAWWFYYK